MSGTPDAARKVYDSTSLQDFEAVLVSAPSMHSWEGVVLRQSQGAPTTSMGWRWTSLPTRDRELLCVALANLLNLLASGGEVGFDRRTPCTWMLVLSSESIKQGLKGTPGA